MRKTEIISKPAKETTLASCDRCNKLADPDNVFDHQEWVSLNVSCGYGSILGDGNEYELDLCQECTVELLGPFLKLKRNYITHKDYTNNEQTSSDRTTREA